MHAGHPRCLTPIASPVDGLSEARRRERSAFTLIELLVVVAIIALLVSILLPSLSRAKELAQTVVCQNRHKGSVTGWGYYASDFNGVYMAPWDQDPSHRWPGITSNYVPMQHVYTFVHYVAGGGLPTGEVLWNRALYPTTPWYGEDGRHSYPPSLCELDDAPQLQCPQVSALGPAANPIWYTETSMSYFIMGRRRNSAGDDVHDLWAYPRPDMMTHQATTGLQVCLSSNLNRPQDPCWCDYVSSPMDLHMDKSNYSFVDGHVETLAISSTRAYMWRSQWTRGDSESLD